MSGANRLTLPPVCMTLVKLELVKNWTRFAIEITNYCRGTYLIMVDIGPGQMTNMVGVMSRDGGCGYRRVCKSIF